MWRLYACVSLAACAFAAQAQAQEGGWELIERLDVPPPVVLNKQSFFPFNPKLIGPPPSGGDFFPADTWIYSLWPSAGNYYAYEGGPDIVMDDVLIPLSRDPSGIGRFRISRVELAIYFPQAGAYTLQGFWTPGSSEFPPEPTEDPHPYLGSNQGPHTLFVPQAGVWRLGTYASANVFTVQTGRTNEDGTNYYTAYHGVRVSRPGAWVVGVPGDPNITDLFVLYQDGEYNAGYFQEAPASFMFRLQGAPDVPANILSGRININGYVGSYTGRIALIRVRQGTLTRNYEVILDPEGNFSLPLDESAGSVDILVQLRPGLNKKVTTTLTGGTTHQNFDLFNGDASGDNRVNDIDLLMVLLSFGTNDASVDLNGDGAINDQDLLLVLFNFGRIGDSL